MSFYAEGMNLLPELDRPQLRYVPLQRFPEAEVEATSSALRFLNALSDHSFTLSADVALFQFCRAQPLTPLISQWTRTAARDGALALRNFSDALASSRSLVGKCPTLYSEVDTSPYKDVMSEFSSKFPRVEKLRHAVAHPEWYAKPAFDMTVSGSVEGEMYTFEDCGTLAMQDTIMNDTFQTTIDGMLLGYDVTLETALTIVRFTRRIYGMIDSAKFPE